jgi:acyl-CoA thioester hydrolase
MTTPAARLLHTHRIPVRWGDIDIYGHVNNTFYFRFFEETRLDWFHRQGQPAGPNGETGRVVVNTACTFLSQITYPSTVIVRMYVQALGRSSMTSRYEVVVDGQEDRLCAEGTAKVVWINTQTGKSIPIPDSVRHLIEANV